MRICPPCNGSGKRWGKLHHACPVCDGEGKVRDIRPGEELCHWCNGNGKKLGSLLTLCEWCDGFGYRIPKLSTETTEAIHNVFYVEAGKPRTAHLNLLTMLQSLNGQIRICDPYYGTGTFFRLDSIADKSICFLTQQPDKNELAKGILPKALAEFVRQHSNIEFRVNQANDLHDRYILTENELILLGHGLKDLGNKDSFIVRLAREIAANTVDDIVAAFDAKWRNATRIP
ncbi:MAG: hypothetical protein WEB58_00930 [Planctomycetaceae bacterium]